MKPKSDNYRFTVIIQSELEKSVRKAAIDAGEPLMVWAGKIIEKHLNKKTK